MEQIVAACILIAAQAYSVPPIVLSGIYQVEQGRVGQEVGPNKNGSYDLGPMQINTIWLPELADHWGVSKEKARQMVRDDACRIKRARTLKVKISPSCLKNRGNKRLIARCTQNAAP